MEREIDRRDFLKTIAVAGAGVSLLQGTTIVEAVAQSPGTPVVIASGNGIRATEKAMELIRAGKDALDAVIAGVNIIEDDPDDMSVGLGGLPNADGIVELDASVMHGPSHRAGAVAALQNIRNPSKVARVVMDRTDHVLLVGEGALKFARMHGFKEENLLTDNAREEWVKWKENLSKEDDYLPPHSINDTDIGYNIADIRFTYGTINCLGLDQAGN
ncbi:MAG: isoaspartyl peptidase/L-asparaginase, partial [Ignavibacteriales bacterium]|nr:isoaspartyl peptidase/L-asparaginase [Ignavibacteriales bacterium]